MESTAAEAWSIIKWISPLNFLPVQESLFGRSRQGTGQWLLDSSAFQAWLDTEGGILWCPGDRTSSPFSILESFSLRFGQLISQSRGWKDDAHVRKNVFRFVLNPLLKTFHRSIVVQRLRELYENQTNGSVGIACIFCDHKETSTQTNVNLLASVWRQLVEGRDDVSDKARALYRNKLTKETRPNQRDILELLRDELQSYSAVYIIVDALDECEDDSSREILIRQFQALQSTARLMVTSRPSASTERLFEGYPTLEIGASPADVRSYVEGRLAQATRLQNHVRADGTLAEEIKHNVVNSAKQMYECHYIRL